MAITGFDERGLIGLHRAAYQERFEGSWAKRLSILNRSSAASEKYGIFGATPGMREWIGARQANVMSKKTYEVRNRKFESTLEVHREDLERDTTDMLEAAVNVFANETVRDHWEDLVIEAINANGTCYDGQAFFSTLHQWGDSGVQKNIVTASEIAALNVADPAAPTPAEFATALLKVIGWQMLIKNDKGRYVNSAARKFVIQVSTPDLFAAGTLATSGEAVVDGLPNPLKGLGRGNYQFDVMMVPSLANASTKFRVYREDGPLKPFILQEEREMEYQMIGRDSEFFFETEKVKMGVNCSRGVGYGLWENAVEAQLS